MVMQDRCILQLLCIRQSFERITRWSRDCHGLKKVPGELISFQKMAVIQWIQWNFCG